LSVSWWIGWVWYANCFKWTRDCERCQFFSEIGEKKSVNSILLILKTWLFWLYNFFQLKCEEIVGMQINGFWRENNRRKKANKEVSRPTFDHIIWLWPYYLLLLTTGMCVTTFHFHLKWLKLLKLMILIDWFRLFDQITIEFIWIAMIRNGLILQWWIGRKWIIINYLWLSSLSLLLCLQLFFFEIHNWNNLHNKIKQINK